MKIVHLSPSSAKQEAINALKEKWINNHRERERKKLGLKKVIIQSA